MLRILALFVFLLFAFPAPASATDVFRCGSEIVKVGDSADTVKKLCGKPNRSESAGKASQKKKSKKNRIDTEESGKSSAKGKKWYYDKGYGDFVYILTFKGSTLNKIETSERGGK